MYLKHSFEMILIFALCLVFSIIITGKEVSSVITCFIYFSDIFEKIFVKFRGFKWKYFISIGYVLSRLNSSNSHKK